MKVTKLAYHRNGVGGLGFYVGIIKDEDGSRKVCIRFSDIDKKVGAIACAVLDIDLLNKDIIGMFEEEGNAWRGDDYSEVIDNAIKKKTEHGEKGLLKERKK